MEEFEKRFTALNAAQRQAVETIDGPVMVVAGPGTGKTELLGVRVANILRKTDMLPGNILCLTFTDSAAVNMRERLVGLLGPDAYKVAVHTFHSFGSEVINQHAEYFYRGAHFRPADDIARYEIVSGLLEKLPHDNPLASKLNDRFTYTHDIETSISELKRGGLMPEELNQIVTKNAVFIAWVKPKLQTVFGDRLSKKTIDLAQKLVVDIQNFDEEPLELSSYHPLSTLVAATLEMAIKEATDSGSTKPLTAWKNRFLEKDAHGQHALKDERRGEKIAALSDIYGSYLLAMQEAELYDYDDMILRVVHALEMFDELRFSLQEQYQYILIDEFQDTNDAQMRLVWNLTNNPAAEGRPNLMVVGDDDQAIYRFQGANLSNILDFSKQYRDVEVIALTENYRSAREILTLARSVITQASERLEHTFEHISKELTAHHAATATIIGETYETITESHAALAQRIADDCKRDGSATRTIIGRHHRELIELLPHLTAAGVSVRYERQDNVLDSKPVQLLEQTAHVLWHIALEEFEAANEHLAEVLAHPAWQLSAQDIWHISIEAHRQKKYWLEIMLEEGGAYQEIAEWFIAGANYAKTEPLEFMLDYIFGMTDSNEFASPYKNYFFGSANTLSSTYLAHLSALQKIRASIRDYRPSTTLKLQDFIEFLELHHELELSMTANSVVETTATSITLLSAHKAKGLEFDAVYIIDAHETVWGGGARARSRLLTFPTNLPLSPTGDTDDERLRLLYVALTRAKTQLTITAARTNSAGKSLLPIGAFSGIMTFDEKPALGIAEAAKALTSDWYQPLLAIDTTDKKALLSPLLERYKLSPTHLNNFLNVTKGGPEYFLLHNLLRLPEAQSPSAAYGSAIHGALQQAHEHLAATKQRRPVEDIVHDFEQLISQSQLSMSDAEKYNGRGAKALTTFLEHRYDSFNEQQLVEQNFASEHIVLDSAVITGKLDLIDIDHDEKTIFVTDYKTGKAARSWSGKNEYEKIKLHHYEQQLMLYKLLIEHSRRFAGYTVTGARIEFVEPDTRNEVVLLDYTYDTEKLIEFTRLIDAVWRHIKAFDFSLPDGAGASYKDILAFEDLLLSE